MYFSCDENYNINVALASSKKLSASMFTLRDVQDMLGKSSNRIALITHLCWAMESRKNIY